MNAIVLFSGGKDSTLALYKTLENKMGVRCLLSLFTENPESYMFHYPNIYLTEMQAEAMEMEILTKSTGGLKEEELDDLRDALYHLRGSSDILVLGAIASTYQKSRVERIASELGFKIYSPLWGMDPEKMWKELLKLGFKIVITAVQCDGLGKEWLGKVIDKKSLNELKSLSQKHRFHLSGEGGEFETLVVDGPVFKRRLEIQESHTEWHGSSGYYIVDKAKLAEK